MSKQNKQDQAPSMNQLANNTPPPANQPRVMMVNSASQPVFGSNMNFNHQGFPPAVNTTNLMQTNNHFFPAFK